ncbi:hypothetical protein AUJ10_00990 [Candidatus Pacearchaeota archaeon CG1_02_31_27]|nr:MAG: hypothetical protein AUJ10_00990 [Candidatus Pacearchaeota archaeon CG1_02_31_27]
MQKITIVGAGKIGSAVAFSLLHLKNNIREIVLIDVIKNLAEGESLDLQHTASAMKKNVKIIGTEDYSFAKNSDIVVITAGKARTPDVKDRLDLLNINKKIIDEILRNVLHHKPKIIILVTNPVDVLTYYIYKKSNMPRNRIIGFGNYLDTARLNSLNLSGIVIGEHGENQIFLTKEINDSQKQELKNVSKKIIELKGYTQYGPAYCIAKTINAILNNTKEIIPCSCVLEGEYGLRDIALGVPAVLTSEGVKIKELKLEKEHIEELKKTADKLQKFKNL